MAGDRLAFLQPLRVRINRAIRVRCEPGWSLRPGWYDVNTDYDFWFVWAGRGWMKVSGRRIELRPGICFWMRPGGDYIAEQDLDHRLGVTAVHFDLCHADGQVCAQRDQLPPESCELTDVGYVDNVLRRVWEITLGQHDRTGRMVDLVTTAEDLLKALVMEYALAADQRTQVHRGDISWHHQKVVQVIAQQITEQPADAPSVEELAQQAGYSAAHFSRMFQKVTGMTPRDYIVRARLSRATHLLNESTLNVGQIADALGYSDVYFFSRQFRQRMGVTPTAYRKRQTPEA